MLVLCDNGIKNSAITKVKKKMDRLRNDQQSDDAADDEQKFISLLYIKGTSETLKRIYLQHTRSIVHFTLKKLFRNIFQNQKIL